MEAKGRMTIGLVSLLLLLIAGCAGYGGLRVECAYQCEQSLKTVLDDFDAYQVFYAGQYPSLAAAILFDPLDDDKAIQPGRWKEVQTREEAMKMIRIIDADTQYPARFYRVLGEQGDSYGYLFTNYVHVPVKQVEPDAVSVTYLPQPAHLKYDGNGFGHKPGRKN